MPSEGFHVHGAHDHTLEHATEHAGAHGGGVDTLAGRVAVLSAVLATLGALMTFAGGDTQANAQLFKNSASIAKTRANDQWNYYEAKGVKRNLAEVAGILSSKPDKAADFKETAIRYRKEQDDIKAKAEAFEEEVKELNHRSDEEMHRHHRWAVGATAMQIAIALSAIALLSRKVWLLYAVGVVGVIGSVFGGLALAGI
jgi:hypothetical protein